MREYMNTMEFPCYLDVEMARAVLAEMGVELTHRQMKRAADRDKHGKRKLPFFIDPIQGTLKIEKKTLIAIYNIRQKDAENDAYFGFHNRRKNYASD